MNDDARINVRVALLPVMLCWCAGVQVSFVGKWGLNGMRDPRTGVCAGLVPLELYWQVR